jgi:protein TonB
VQPSAAPTAVAGLASGTAGSSGPVATVSVPAELVRGGTGGGSGTGPATRDGRGGGGEGGVGGGSGDVDTGDPDFSEYFRVIERRVRAAWRFPEGLAGTTQTVKIGFAVGPDGSLRDVRVVSSSSDGLNDSALTAMARAAPFPPLPQKFRALAGQPLVMSFTMTIR